MAAPEAKPRKEIPFNRSATLGKELQYIAESLLIGQIAGNQAFTRRCEDLLTSVTGVKKTLLTTSCTHALEMASLLLRLQPGDEVILPSYTFVSTANAFALRGAKPVFADIRADTMNIDETKLEELVSPRTKAVVVVHYAGVACEMDAITDICRRRKLALVEDNAHGLFGKYRGRPLGTFGDVATLSFHETKNLTCGEGGALGINNPDWIDRAEVLREKGTNRTAFFRGQVDKYTWVDLGSSYVMSDVLAAFLYGQLERWEHAQAARKRIWEYYHLQLSAWAADRGIQTPTVPAHCDQAYHMYYLVFPDLEQRQDFIAHLRKQNIVSVFHYQPLHLSTMGREFGGKPGDCPVAEQMGDRLVRLPFYNELSREEQAAVVRTALGWS
ncbi:MAG TPA: dTDP-4-amino-4,6-dideoxygalactose transaminase [Planctomycetia bacterium]|nr:dTDP-4-amino-4,6-dideoxygalactose transaminase [Planctomycetia bacterium]